MIDPSTINPFNLPSVPLEQRSQLPAFDSKKFFLGKLCKFEHRWNGTGQSLRYRSSYRCVECSNSKNEQKRYEVTEVAIQSNADSLTATARVSCFALRYRQDPKGLAFTILCGSVRVFHDEKSRRQKTA